MPIWSPSIFSSLSLLNRRNGRPLGTQAGGTREWPRAVPIRRPHPCESRTLLLFAHFEHVLQSKINHIKIGKVNMCSVTQCCQWQGLILMSYLAKKINSYNSLFFVELFFFVEKKNFQIFSPKRPERCTIERAWKFYPFLPKTEVKKVNSGLIYGQKPINSKHLKYEIVVFWP